MSYADKVCVIGAGPAGLAAAKNLRQHGLAVDLIERAPDLGGNWLFGSPGSSVYASTHLISSKRMTQFTDFPMPKEFPPYLHHTQALSYLRSYALRFGLRECIEFGRTVEWVEPANGGSEEAWRVRLDHGEERTYWAVVVANGHHSDPLWPQIPGDFSGRLLHAHDYKTPDILVGKRVLVIGAGNSGCDIAVEAAQHAEIACQSFRRGYHFLPKFLFGGPLDSGGEVFDRWHVPAWLRQRLTGWLTRIAVGPPERYGLPKPDHRLFETHPIVNSQLPYFLGHGRLKIRPAVKLFSGENVSFVDGTSEPFDVVICATGYKTSLPFMDSRLVFDETGHPQLFLQAFHPSFHRFFVAGLIQPNGAIWPLVDWQSQLIAVFLRAQINKSPSAEWFCKKKTIGWQPISGGYGYDASPRHHLEVEFFDYRRQLQRHISRFPRPAKPLPA